MYRLNAIVLCLLGLACATPTLLPSDLRVEEVSYGIYDKRGDNLTHIRETEETDCARGRNFGAQVSIDFEASGPVRLPLRGEVTTDVGPGESTSTEFFLPQPFEVPARGLQMRLDMINTLELPTDFQDADYRMRLFDPASGETYYERTLRVRGCADDA